MRPFDADREGEMPLRFVLVILVAMAGAPGLAHAEDSGTAGKGAIIYTGGDGASLETAITIVGAGGENDGVAAEYAWIATNRPGFKRLTQALLSHAGHSYYRLDLLSPQGERVSIYFDISDFFGKFWAPGSRPRAGRVPPGGERPVPSRPRRRKCAERRVQR